eukprot:m.319349 g.319349  ORF g.319349 m.319349 type:complete len:150 (+) comp23128_c0_seq1:133-582(+)
MKLELCHFSGYKIHPGHGRQYTRVDGKTFNFLSSKTQSLFHQRKNPRKILWTVLYRRKHKKGIAQETSKKRTRKTQKFQRPIVGATQEKIKELRNQKPEYRAAQRQQAVRTAKEKAKTAKAKKPTSAAAASAKAAKKVQKAAPRVGGKR